MPLLMEPFSLLNAGAKFGFGAFFCLLVGPVRWFSVLANVTIVVHARGHHFAGLGQAPPAITCSTSATLRGTCVMLRAPLSVTTTLSSSRTPPNPWVPKGMESAVAQAAHASTRAV